MLCAKVVPMVHGFEKTYGDRMNFVVKDWKTGDSPAEIKRYFNDRHGMVIIDKAGNKLWSEDGHKQKPEVVEAAIKKVLG